MDTATRAQEGDAEGKSDAALARIFDDPSFRPFLYFPSVARTLHLPALRAWNTPAGSARHEEPVNLRVFLHEFLYTIPQSAHYKNYEYLSAGRSVVRKRYQVVTSLFDVDCL